MSEIKEKPALTATTPYARLSPTRPRPPPLLALLRRLCELRDSSNNC